MTKKSELSLMWQMKREAERDFNKFIKYVAELEKENKELKEYWSIEIKTCNRYREKCDELEKENRNLKKEFEQYKQHYNIDSDRQTIFLMTWKRY